eukprot:gb/GECG01003032.1/.p1 GENE.gb/GECG01003032.1/~~gb/GECG01003032.1/.p1  ORF type:complete len:116 (+),score=7.64 gb/GECG01003032.1/:1-348(+)
MKKHIRKFMESIHKEPKSQDGEGLKRIGVQRNHHPPHRNLRMLAATVKCSRILARCFHYLLIFWLWLCMFEHYNHTEKRRREKKDDTFVCVVELHQLVQLVGWLSFPAVAFSDVG